MYGKIQLAVLVISGFSCNNIHYIYISLRFANTYNFLFIHEQLKILFNLRLMLWNVHKTGSLTLQQLQTRHNFILSVEVELTKKKEN